MNNVLQKALSWASTILFPEICIGCQGIVSEEDRASNCPHLCASCAGRIPYLPRCICPACRRRIAFGPRGGLGAHASCRVKRPYALIAATSYRDPVARELIATLKYRRIRSAAGPLAALLAPAICAAHIPALGSFAVVPVPLHAKRLKRRGFNQSELIAQRIAAELGLILHQNALTRTRNNPPQARIADVTKREENARRCFSAVAVPGKSILLIDDVATSGATLAGAARALKDAGAKSIIGAVVAFSD